MENVKEKMKNWYFGVGKSVGIMLVFAALILSSCGLTPYKIDLRKTGGIYLIYQMDKNDFTYEDEYEESLELMAYLIRMRLSGYYTTEVYINEDNICVEISKEQDVDKCKEIIERKTDLYFIRQNDDKGNLNYVEKDGQWELTKKIDELLIDGSIPLTYKDVSEAKVGYQQDYMQNEEVIISLVMTDEGTKKFAEMTQEAYENGNASIAIYYGGKIVTAPKVQAVITNGRAVITGYDSFDEAERMASDIRIGPLPHDIQCISSEVFERKKLEK